MRQQQEHSQNIQNRKTVSSRDKSMRNKEHGERCPLALESFSSHRMQIQLPAWGRTWLQRRQPLGVWHLVSGFYNDNGEMLASVPHTCRTDAGRKAIGLRRPFRKMDRACTRREEQCREMRRSPGERGGGQENKSPPSKIGGSACGRTHARIYPPTHPPTPLKFVCDKAVRTL